MSNISSRDVEQVAELARLELAEEEKEKYTKELGDILNYVEELNQAPVEAAREEKTELELVNIARVDKITNENDRENLLVNTPSQEKGYIKVKKVFGE